MQAAAGGYSEIKFLFSHINLDRRVLFGDNYNYKFPSSPAFPIQNLVSHFVCTKLVPLELAVIMPAEYARTDDCTCIVITINDLPFQARVIPFKVLHSTLYSSFGASTNFF